MFKNILTLKISDLIKGGEDNELSVCTSPGFYRYYNFPSFVSWWNTVRQPSGISFDLWMLSLYLLRDQFLKEQIYSIIICKIKSTVILIFSIFKFVSGGIKICQVGDLYLEKEDCFWLLTCLSRLVCVNFRESSVFFILGSSKQRPPSANRAVSLVTSHTVHLTGYLVMWWMRGMHELAVYLSLSVEIRLTLSSSKRRRVALRNY